MFFGVIFHSEKEILRVWCKCEGCFRLWYGICFMYSTFLSHLFPLPCGAGSTVAREGIDSSVIMPFFLVCCGCDTSYIVSVHIQCQTSIYTLLLCRGHSWRVRLAKQETLTPPGHRVSPLVYRGPWMSSGTLLLMPQWQCISSFVFYIIKNWR